MLSTLWAIVRNSFVEIVRQPVYAILLAAGIALIGLAPAITMFSMASDEALMVDMGLATTMLLGIILAVLSATQVISREIESHTVGAIISKPVGRTTFVVGKFLAVSLAMAAACYLLTIVMLIVVRIGVPSTASWTPDWPAFVAGLVPLFGAMAFGIYANFFYRWNFCSTAILAALLLYTVAFGLLLLVNAGGRFEPLPHVFAERNALQIAQASFLVFLGVWVLSSVAVAASTRLDVVVNVLICLAVFFVGMTSQFLFGRAAAMSVRGVALAILFLAPWALLLLPLRALGRLTIATVVGAATGAVLYMSSPAREMFASAWTAYAWVAERVIPGLYVFWVGDQLMSEIPLIPVGYILVSMLYAAAVSAAMLSFAAFLFERREVI